jgi:hypothetical protein
LALRHSDRVNGTLTALPDLETISVYTADVLIFDLQHTEEPLGALVDAGGDARERGLRRQGQFKREILAQRS